MKDTLRLFGFQKEEKKKEKKGGDEIKYGALVEDGREGGNGLETGLCACFRGDLVNVCVQWDKIVSLINFWVRVCDNLLQNSINSLCSVRVVLLRQPRSQHA